MHDDRPMT